MSRRYTQEQKELIFRTLAQSNGDYDLAIDKLRTECGLDRGRNNLQQLVCAARKL